MKANKRKLRKIRLREGGSVGYWSSEEDDIDLRWCLQLRLSRYHLIRLSNYEYQNRIVPNFCFAFKEII